MKELIDYIQDWEEYKVYDDEILDLVSSGKIRRATRRRKGKSIKIYEVYLPDGDLIRVFPDHVAVYSEWKLIFDCPRHDLVSTFWKVLEEVVEGE